MTGGVNCGGGRRTRLTIVGVSSSGAPLIYIGWRGGEAAKGVPQVGGILLGVLPIRPPPFPIPIRSRKGEGGILFPFSFPPSPFLLQFFQPIWEGRTSPFVDGVLPLLAHKAHIFCRGCPEPLPMTRYVPGTLRTLPVSIYYRPIYESLPHDHFETPRHVRDLIRDSEQHSVTKSHNSSNTNRHRTLSVRTLRVRELCRHDRDTSPVNNQ